MIFINRLLRILTRPAVPADFAMFAFGAVLCLGLVGYFQIDTTAPGSLAGDHLFVITAAKSYINGHGFRLDSQLGFPDTRDWLYFPSFDLSYRIVLWLATRLTHSPFRAVHILYIVGVLAMFGFAYWTLRRLGVRAWLAVLGAIASILTPFMANRAFTHDFLALSFGAPLGFGLALELGLAQPEQKLKAFVQNPYVIVASLVSGTSGLYYGFYTLMFVSFAGVAAAIGQRRAFPLLAAITIAVTICGLLVFSGYGLDLPLVLSGRFAQPHRLAFEQLIYGLDLPMAAIPFRFLHKVAEGVAQSRASTPFAFAAEGPGEWPSFPLTGVLLGAPLIAAICQQRLRDGSSATSYSLRLISLCAMLILFGILFAARGGLGYLFNLVVNPDIRADARLMPFLTFAAIAVICAMAESVASAHRAWLRYGGAAAAALALLVSMRANVSVLHKAQQDNLMVPAFQQMRTSTPAMLKAKDYANLKAVLELPVGSWPETPPIHDFDVYSHQLAYIYDRPGAITHWSYGANEKQPWFALVNFEAGEPKTVPAGARALGFDGILVEKKGYDASGLAELQASLSDPRARACRLYEDEVMTLYALKSAC